MLYICCTTLSKHSWTLAVQGSGNLHGQSTLRTFMCVFIDGEEREVGHPEEVELLRIKTQVS